MTMKELTHTIVNCPDEWEQVKEMEDRFREVSPQAFADERWSKDSWAEGARLFWPQSRIAKKPITTHEIERLVIDKANELVNQR